MSAGNDNNYIFEMLTTYQELQVKYHLWVSQ